MLIVSVQIWVQLSVEIFGTSKGGSATVHETKETPASNANHQHSTRTSRISSFRSSSSSADRFCFPRPKWPPSLDSHTTTDRSSTRLDQLSNSRIICHCRKLELSNHIARTRTGILQLPLSIPSSKHLPRSYKYAWSS